jgi:hypothetical protein
MKSARVCLWPAKASQNPQAPCLNGAVEIPAQLVWELSQLMANGQGMEVNERTGEQFFRLRLSVWRGTGENNGPVLNGQFESPTERATYEASKAQQQGGGGWGAAAQPFGAAPQPQAQGQPQPQGQPAAGGYAPQGQPPAGYPPAGYAPAGQPPAGYNPGPAYPAAAPAAAPQPAAAPPQSGWGQTGGWGQ